MSESYSSDKMLLRTVQVQTKIFIKNSRVWANSVCHLTLRVSTPFSCNPGQINAADVVLVVMAL